MTSTRADSPDAVAMERICAVLNSGTSGADAFQQIAALIAATGRPYVDHARLVRLNGPPIPDEVLRGVPGRQA